MFDDVQNYSITTTFHELKHNNLSCSDSYMAEEHAALKATKKGSRTKRGLLVLYNMRQIGDKLYPLETAQ